MEKKGQQERNLTHTPGGGGEAEAAKFCAGLSLETWVLEGRQPSGSCISCDGTFSATWLKLRRD